ncbi:MAG: hypothetical protein K6F07_04170 [Bacilli bacterium]|nr:hypothetical protein [Bacilli bacterium]
MIIMKERKLNIFKRILNAFYYVFMGALLTLDVFLIIGRVNSSKNGVSNFFGTQLYTVLTGSMEGSDEFYAEHPEFEIKKMPISSAVFVKNAPQPILGGEDEATKIKKQQALTNYYTNVKVGDVMTFVFQSNKNYIVTHRVIEIKENSGVFTITLRGDNPSGDQKVTKNSPTQTVTSDSGLVIGKVTGINVGLGKFIVNYLQNGVAFGCTVLIPAGLILIYEVIKIVLIFMDERKEKLLKEHKEASDAKDLELEELRKKVAALEKQQETPNKEE